MSARTESTSSRGGRRPKGGGVPRAQTTVRYPESHRSVYEQNADRLGISLSDYFAYMIAQAAGLPVPNYIVDQIDAAAAQREREQEHREIQDALLEAS